MNALENALIIVKFFFYWLLVLNFQLFNLIYNEANIDKKIDFSQISKLFIQ